MQKQRIPIRRRSSHSCRSDRAAGSADVFDDDLLLERLGHRLREQASDGIGRTAGGERHDNRNYLVGIFLRAYRRRDQ